MPIDDVAFGKIVVDGTAYNTDVKIVGGTVIADWWRRSGHRVEIEDIRDILRAAPEVLVIGMGNPGLMKATVALRRHLENEGIALVEETTDAAAKTFNRLSAEKRAVAGGFHVGC